MSQDESRSTIDKLMTAVPWIGGALLLLFFTPVGGIVKVIGFFGGLIGAGLFFWCAFENLRQRDFAGARNKGLVAIALLAIAVIAVVVLPDPNFYGGSDRCWDGRSNPRC